MKELKWHNEKRLIKDLIPFESNPRQLSKEQYEQLKKSLSKFDLAEIPVIDTDNKIVAGHQRLKILAEIKGKDYEIDVRVPNRKLTENEFKEYNVRSNKNTGAWDFDILSNDFELTDLLEWGFDENELGFVNEIAFPELKDGDREPFQQMTFTLADKQAEIIKNAITDIKKTETYKYAETLGNKNSNGNALYLIVMQWAEQKKY